MTRGKPDYQHEMIADALKTVSTQRIVNE